MKSKLTLSCLLFSTMLMAQVDNNPTNIISISDISSLKIIPTELSYNGDNRICVWTDEDEISVYNNNFQRSKLLSIKASAGEEKNVIEERAVIDGMYADEWTIVRTNSYTYPIDGIMFANYDAPNANIRENITPITQTLFNSDENYEYLDITYTTELSSESCLKEVVFCDADGNYVSECIQRILTYRSKETGFEIKSDNGNVLQTISFTDGFDLTRNYVYAIQIGGNYFLIFDGEIDEEDAILVYKINRPNTGASVQQVTDPQRVAAAYKFLRNGQVYIKSNDKTYTITGAEVK